MLPKRSRLTRKDIPLVLKGQTRHSASFTLRFKRSETGSPRFAVVVSKKVAKGAVERNTLRRRGYAALSEALQGAGAPPLSGALFMKKEGVSTPYAALLAEIQAALAAR
jgi:ribonuclease P protein component